jgi:class 3 adenylate cyclase
VKREIRYCTADDGVLVAYSVEGSGPSLLLCPHLIESFAFEDSAASFAEFVTLLGRGRTIIRYDLRGTGLSDRDPADLSLGGQVLDLEAVVAAAGVGAVAIMAPTLSGARAVAFAARHPDLVRSLVLYGTGASGDEVMSAEEAHALALLAKTDWVVGSITLADLGGRQEWAEVNTEYAEWYRVSADGPTAARIIEECHLSDVRSMLERVMCPTLVLHRPNDPAIPFSCAQALASGIPDARLVPLPGANHMFAVGDPVAVLEAIDAFFDDIEPQMADGHRDLVRVGKSTGLRTVLFTDIEESTSIANRLGDVRARELMREHEQITRDALASFGGSEIKAMGDGFMASFVSVTAAVQCAASLQRAFAERNETAAEKILIRAGINAGEPIEEDGDLFGSTVILASRIAARAKGGQILVADTVRGLCAGKGVRFVDAGTFVPKGFDEETRVYEVDWAQ